jgi:iron complex transport system ATP-binding protein
MSAAAPPVLELNHASVVKCGRAVLDDLTLSIKAGEHTAIIGPNGAGKSTLINLLTHDDRPFGGGEPGAVKVLGRDRWTVAELRRRLGVVSADLHHRFAHGNSAGPILAVDAVLSAFDAAYGFVNRDAGTGEMRRATLRALARMGVEHLAQTPLNRMSTGEVRRVLIARALVTSPEALVLDEPTTGLDLVARQEFLAAIRRIARGGTTLVLVTHRVEEIVPEIQRVVLLKRGRVAADGPRSSTLTSAALSDAFAAPILLEERDGFVTARVYTAASEAPDGVTTRR